MKKYLHILALFLAIIAAPALAQTPAAAPAKSDAVTINQADLKKLVTTLKDDKSRKDLIDNLETLSKTAPVAATAAPASDAPADANAPADAPKTDADANANTEKEVKSIAPITKTLGVDSFTGHLIWKYQHFLVRNDLNESSVGKMILTGILLLVGAIVIFITRRGATKMLYWFDRAVAWLDLPAARMRFYAKGVRSIVTVLLLGLLVFTFTLIWTPDHDLTIKLTHYFRTIMGSLINVVFVVVLATVAWESLNALIEMLFRRADGSNSTRAKTIMPIVRNILFLVFAIMFALVLLSELGINILPLLAGAGVVGVAVGFGAQTLVKDYLAGFTIVFEDIVRVGDNVKLGDIGGVVEKITLRKIQLRGGNNAVYTIPFSAISIIQNNTKDFSSFDWDISVPFDTDAEKVFALLRDVSKSMRADPTFGPMMLDDIDIWGVDSVTDSGQIIKGRLKTVAGQQWGVQREFVKRKVVAFEKAGLPNAAMPRSFQISQVIGNYPAQPQPTSKEKGTDTPNP